MAKRKKTPRADVCQLVTDKIVQALEGNIPPWRRPWQANTYAGLPLRHNGEPYRGINILLLWSATQDYGFSSGYWMTYKQAVELGGQVRKGEKSEPVFYYGTAPIKDAEAKEDEEEFYRFLKSYRVFNADQIDGLPDRFYGAGEADVSEISSFERIEELELFISSLPSVVVHGGGQAYYRPSSDQIHMPEFETFESAESYYLTLLHEHVHWTGHDSRLDRDLLGTAFSTPNRAREELIAELGSAFLGWMFGFAPQHIDNHSAYIAHWLEALKNDKRLIFAAAAKAQQAVDYLNSVSSRPVQVAA